VKFLRLAFGACAECYGLKDKKSASVVRSIVADERVRWYGRHVRQLGIYSSEGRVYAYRSYSDNVLQRICGCHIFQEGINEPVQFSCHG